MTTRIGILGGTFDPIHYGHLAIAEEARVLLQFDQVLFVPAAQQPLKRNGHVATPTQRLEMARLACADNPNFVVSPLEIERQGPSYTADTLRALDAAGLGELHFILGADATAEIYRWRAASTIIELARIVVVGRPGVALDHAALDRKLPGLARRLTLLDGPRLEISSSAMRQRIAAGQPIRYQTPDIVIAYIAAQGLYRADHRPPTTDR
jgi:nicotinate-nucleotide adenylyltransferase